MYNSAADDSMEEWNYGSQNDMLNSTSLDKFRWSHKRTGSSSSSSTAGRKELDARERGIERGSYAGVGVASDRRVKPVVFFEESEPKEWAGQVEPVVFLIKFLLDLVLHL